MYVHTSRVSENNKTVPYHINLFYGCRISQVYKNVRGERKRGSIEQQVNLIYTMQDMYSNMQTKETTSFGMKKISKTKTKK